ncbi:MAG: DUF4407 domain-containing protein [Bacteroidales bacterium]|jgi:hypothetical protein|nr:DUF4407 domain-containing protein [Bacteroidales bacterium]
MNLWIRIGCFLTGWNRRILESCSEASYKHLKKYTAALTILIILWAFTGYCFADRYIQASWWGCAISSFIFVVVVIQIERQIILTVGHTWRIIWFRVFIAVIMSLIGSSIIDQIIFADDIDRKMIEITDRQVEELLPARMNLYDAELEKVQIMIDSLDRMNLKLNAEVAKNPTITTIATQTAYFTVTASTGKDSIVSRTSVNKTPIPNPRIEQVNVNGNNLKLFREQQKEFTEKKITAKEDLRKELGSKTGFLEELSAMLEILGSRIEALIFYLVIFCFLVSLELFVVFSKFWDKKCDYDAMIEHQLKTKLLTLEQLRKTKDG